MEQKQIVISGIGTISPLGSDLEQVTSALASPPGLSTVREFEFHSFDEPVPCIRITDYDPVEVLGKKGLRNKDYATKMLLGAAETGFKTVMEECSEEERPGLCVGTAFGSIQSIGDFLSDSIVNGVNTVNPQSFANTVINSPTGNANIRYFARNLSATLSTGFNAGMDAIIYAFDHIRQGYMERIIAGGLEEISYYSLLGCMRTGILSKGTAVRPFAADGDGVIMGEGCVLFMLESAQSAQKRGSKILAEIAGCANGFDPAALSGGQPDGAVYRMVVESACEQAQIKPEEIDMIASGAGGNRVSDALEAKAIASVFGPDKPVTAYKAFTGECYGASGALNVLCAMADMSAGHASGIPLEPYAHTRGIKPLFGRTAMSLNHVLVLSCSCDGNCSAIILKKVK